MTERLLNYFKGFLAKKRKESFSNKENFDRALNRLLKA